MPRPKNTLKGWLNFVSHQLWRGSLWRKFITLSIAVVILLTSSAYAIAFWYTHKHDQEPLLLGTTFVADYAKRFGLDPHQTLEAILGDLNMKDIRLVSYWKEIEPTQGQYDFSELDWQFDTAKRYGAEVSLAIGLRQPRWPECHEPAWANNQPKSFWQPKLYDYMTAVVNRYKDNPVLKNYQLENEFFMEIFGDCPDFDGNRLVEEFEMVKKLDPKHPILISRSNNWIGIPISPPTPDQFAISVYKRVWDDHYTNRYVEYPLPPWFYAFLAGAEELVSGKDMMLHELQAEPWAPRQMDIVVTPLEEQAKSMNAEMLKKRIQYGIDTGMRTIELWGAEWWYWMKQKNNDPGTWNVAKQAVSDAEKYNKQLLEHKN